MNNWMTVTEPVTLEQEVLDVLNEALAIWRGMADENDSITDAIYLACKNQGRTFTVQTGAVTVAMNTTSWGHTNKEFSENVLVNAIKKVENAVKYNFPRPELNRFRS